MKIVFAGIIGRYPWGGVTWCSLMYLLGLRKLGHEVYYLEDTQEANFDPEKNGLAEKPDYALRYIHESLAPFGFGDRWCYVDYLGNHHGIEREKWESICREADLFLVLSGGCWVWRDHYRNIPVKAYIDSDPGFTQFALHRAEVSAREGGAGTAFVKIFRGYDRLFTFGSGIGKPGCDVPLAGFEWKHTWQPISPEFWNTEKQNLPSRDAWTTVMTWQIESFTDIGGFKDEEFRKVLDMPSLREEKGLPLLELAISREVPLLKEHGWRCVNAMNISSDLWRYHAFLSTSRGEFSVAKKTYVESKSGWFSDRTECYLAAGKPAVVQDTGWTKTFSTGRGLFGWRTLEEAVEGLLAVEANYERHSKWAAELALEHFEDRKVLGRLLEECE